MKLMLKYIEKEIISEIVVAKVMCVYKELMTKQFFLTIPSFDEFDRTGPNLARVVKEVIKRIKNKLHGSGCSDEVAAAIATKAWQRLRAEYQAEPTNQPKEE